MTVAPDWHLVRVFGSTSGGLEPCCSARCPYFHRQPPEDPDDLDDQDYCEVTGWATKHGRTCRPAVCRKLETIARHARAVRETLLAAGHLTEALDARLTEIVRVASEPTRLT